MDYLPLGLLIRRLRKLNGISQDKLAEGIMDRGNLARVERGQQNISKDKMDLLLNRLGTDSKRFFPYVLSDEEFENYELRSKLENYLVRRRLKDATKLIREMEAIPDFKQGLSKQFLLKSKAALSDLKGLNINRRYKYLVEAIKITVPKFKETMVHTYLLAGDDIEIIGMMAGIHTDKGEHRKANDLLQKLALNIKNHYMDEYEKARSLTFVLFNLSCVLDTQKRYEEMLAVCDEAIAVSEENQIYGLLPQLKFNKARCLFYLDRKDEVKELLLQAYYGSLALGHAGRSSFMSKFASEELQIEIEA